MQYGVGVDPAQVVNGHRSPAGFVPGFVHHGIEIVVEPVAPEGGLDVVHEWGMQSFPASDPPANW